MKQVNSPVNTANTSSRLSENTGLSPGARSMPGAKRDSVPGQRTHSAPPVKTHSEEPSGRSREPDPDLEQEQRGDSLFQRIRNVFTPQQRRAMADHYRFIGFPVDK
jgi:hypothetical protein